MVGVGSERSPFSCLAPGALFLGPWTHMNMELREGGLQTEVGNLLDSGTT